MVNKNIIRKILRENSDFDWLDDINPLSKEEISNKLESLAEFGYHSSENSYFVKELHSLALPEESLNRFIKALHDLSYSIHLNGYDFGAASAHSEAYEEGYEVGRNDGLEELEYKYEEGYEKGYEKGYEEGYDEGSDDGYKRGYDEGSEETYHKAFEEGREYQYRIDNENYERDESDFGIGGYYDDDF